MVVITGEMIYTRLLFMVEHGGLWTLTAAFFLAPGINSENWCKRIASISFFITHYQRQTDGLDLRKGVKTLAGRVTISPIVYILIHVYKSYKNGFPHKNTTLHLYNTHRKHRWTEKINSKMSFVTLSSNALHYNMSISWPENKFGTMQLCCW